MQHNPIFNSVPLMRPSLVSILLTNYLPHNAEAAYQTHNLNFSRTFFRNKFIKLFKQIKYGFIIIEDPIEILEFGDSNNRLTCRIKVHDLATYTKFALAGSNGSAEAYIEGLWSCDDPSALIQILLRNRQQLDSMENGLAKFAQLTYQTWHSFNRNSKSGSKKNIAAHYDLGNDFFRLFLDQRMMYSSALYSQTDQLDDLQTASDRKMQRICDVLKLNSKDNVIEIGSGWGGFACYAASKTGCKITTITISKEQFDESVARVKRENLSHLVTVELIDYRDIKGQFDKLVSIEMIEAVGHQYLDGYFNKINKLLKPSGQALLQAIVIDDDRYEQALKEVDYIKRFIFPGSFIPCYNIIEETASNNELELKDLYDMGSSYALTLRDWRKQFYNQIDKIDKLGYDNEFKRMWEFYLCYCEGGFKERAISVGQLLFQKK